MKNTTLTKIRKKYPDKRISFVSGHFRIIHAGHIRLLRFAKETADILVVGVLPSSAHDAGFSETERQDNVRALSVVDEVFLISSLQEDLRTLHPEFVVKGPEHEYQSNPEMDVLSEYGGKLLFSAGAVTPSIADIPAIPIMGGLKVEQPKEFLVRHGITQESVHQLCARMRDMRTVVIGDTIVDVYVNCDPLGMSQEDPTIVVAPVEWNKYLGGAGIVAAHAASLGASVHFATVCGQDAAADFVRNKLEEYHINQHIFVDDTRPTTMKERYRCRGKTLLRVSHLRQHAVEKNLCAAMLERLEGILDSADVLIFSDFNYGVLPQLFVEKVTTLAKEKGIFMAADSQSSSQVGDVSRFKHAALLTPTEREARLAVHDFESGLVVLANKLLHKCKGQYVCMTLGEAGVLVQSQESSATDQLGALNPRPVDLAGAGDSFLVSASLACAAGADIWHAAYIGSLAAAIQVSRQGNVPVCSSDIELCARR